jgi:hypothetical protein
LDKEELDFGRFTVDSTFEDRMRSGWVLAYGAAICASWAEIVDAIELDLSSTGKRWNSSRQIIADRQQNRSKLPPLQLRTE